MIFSLRSNIRVFATLTSMLPVAIEGQSNILSFQDTKLLELSAQIGLEVTKYAVGDRVEVGCMVAVESARVAVEERSNIVLMDIRVAKNHRFLEKP